MSKFEHTVLIIDDDLLSVTALTHLLSDEFNVVTERDGRKSLEVVKEVCPDVILLDVVMPDMNGFEVISELKKEQRTKDIPVIFVTGLNNTRDEEKGLVLGAADYINKPFSSYIVKLRIRNQLQISSQIQKIRELSITDPLTGVGSRKHFNNILQMEWKRASRSQTPISFAIFCIDNFKQYNEEYGHQKGDDALKQLSRIISDGVRRVSDQVVRWGGDEFGIILPATNLEGAKKVAEDIRQAIEHDTLATDSVFLTGITASAGVHSHNPLPKDTYTIDNFILDTSTALTCAKETGRNKVSTYDEVRGME